MEIWLDTSNSEAIKAASVYGLILGITTNPSIIAKAELEQETLLTRILEDQDGPVAVQVIADDVKMMISQAVKLHTFSDRIIVKVPVTSQGLVAIKELSSQGISTMATAVFQPHQALLAALAGAEYVAPYVRRMDNVGIDSINALRTIKLIYQQYRIKTKMIAAALESVDQIISLAEIGVDAVTINEALFSKFIADDPNTMKSLEGFMADWEQSKHKHSSFMSE